MNRSQIKLPSSAAALLLAALSVPAFSQTTDALLNKLVQKGILTDKEALDLKQEAEKGAKAALPASKVGVADWVNNLKFSGDFRGRYDGIFQDNSANGTPDRDRFRYRLRFGATLSMSDHFEVGLRLASGDVFAPGGVVQPIGGNTYSANTTLNGDASRKWLFVDAAYAKWSPKDWFQAQFGKMDNVFWITDAVIDYDYQPEGGQEKLSYDLNENHKISLTAGQWVVAENYSAAGAAPASDTYLFVNQLDWTAKWASPFSSRVGVGAMNYANQKSIPVAYAGILNQNGTPASGPGSVSFNPVIARGELTYNLDSFPMFHGTFPITVGGEYINNPATRNDNEAYNLGVTFGSSKKKGNWQISYNYKNIETAALWYGLNDDDFGYNAKGGTDVRGHHIKASFKPADPFTIGLSYYVTEAIKGTPGVFPRQNRIFVDLVWAF